MRRWLAIALLAAAPWAGAQQDLPPNGVFLVAKPELRDPNFRETVVFVTQAPDASTVGVILNRPTPLKLSQFLSDGLPTENYRDAIFFGGPVMRRSIVALFRSEIRPTAAAFPVLKDVYLTMHLGNIEPLLASRERRYRLYAGFSGWAPRQLEGELARDSWFVLPPSEEAVFRQDTTGMWQEMLAKALGSRAHAAQDTP